MLRLIFFLALLIASVWLGMIIFNHPGYLLVVYQPWMVQMPLWFAFLSFVLFFTFFYFLIHSIDALQFLWFRIKNWFRFRREHKLFSKTQQGLAMLIEGRWKKAESFLLKGINSSVDPLMNYLGAAKAADELGAYDRRDLYLRKAYQAAPRADLAIGLTQADMELKQGRLEQAVATLNHLRLISPRHPRVLKLLEKAYVRLGDWKNLLLLLPAMRKAKVLTVEQVEQVEKNVYCELLRTLHPVSFVELEKMWNDFPRHIRKQPDVVYEYVKKLPAFSAYAQMEELIYKALKQHWHGGLVLLYSTLPFANLNRQLVIADDWLKRYGAKAETYLLLARLCVRVQLWGKAKDYYAKCLALGPNAQASLGYGDLLNQLNEPELANEQYRNGLLQSE